MRVPIGEMREPAVLITPTVTVDEHGGEVTNYEASDTIFIALRPQSAREQNANAQVSAEASHTVFGHWHDLHSVTGDQRLRLVEDSTEYDIVGLPLNSPLRDYTRLNVLLRENG